MEPEEKEAYSLGRLIEKIDNLTKLFKEHKEDDDKHFTNLYNIGRDMPQKVMDTIEDKMKDKYVTRDEFHELKRTLVETTSCLIAKLDSIRLVGGLLGLVIAGVQIYKLF